MSHLYAPGPFGLLVSAGERRGSRKSSELTQNHDAGEESSQFYVNLILWELEKRLKMIANRRDVSTTQDHLQTLPWLTGGKESKPCSIHPAVRLLIEEKARKLSSDQAEAAMERWRSLDLSNVELEDIPGVLVQVLDRMAQNKEPDEESEGKPPFRALYERVDKWINRHIGRCRRVGPWADLESGSGACDLPTYSRIYNVLTNPTRNFKTVFCRSKTYNKFGDSSTDETPTTQKVSFYKLPVEHEEETEIPGDEVKENHDCPPATENATCAVKVRHTPEENIPEEMGVDGKIKDKIKMNVQQDSTVVIIDPSWMRLNELSSNPL